MRIIEPSAKNIEDELSGLSVDQRIDRCCSVCYQRPAKATEEEAQKFCRSLIKRGHYPALEMAVVHLSMDWEDARHFKGSKYLMVGRKWEKGVVTGSIRAWMESGEPFADWVRDCFLCYQFPSFFREGGDDETDEISFSEEDKIPWQHQHVAARFIVSRDISHELVRHRPCSILQESQRYCRYGEDVTFIRPEWAGACELPWLCGFEYECAYAESRYHMYLREGLKPQQARAVLPNSTKTELIVYANLVEWKHIFAMRDSPAADPEMRRVMAPLHAEFKEKYPEAFE